MITRRKRRKFSLIEINKFDARRGYKRCSSPGVGVSLGRDDLGQDIKAVADFWKDPLGRIVVRFSSGGYTYHFEAMLTSGKQIPENKMGDFEDYVMEVLTEWLIEGIDDLPNSIFET